MYIYIYIYIIYSILFILHIIQFLYHCIYIYMYIYIYICYFIYIYIYIYIIDYICIIYTIYVYTRYIIHIKYIRICIYIYIYIDAKRNRPRFEKLAPWVDFLVSLSEGDSRSWLGSFYVTRSPHQAGVRRIRTEPGGTQGMDFCEFAKALGDVERTMRFPDRQFFMGPTATLLEVAFI